MTNGSHIRAVDEAAISAEALDDAPEAIAVEEASDDWDYDQANIDISDDSARWRWGAILAAISALATMAAWTGYFVWSNWSAIVSGASQQQWIAWVSIWATPIVLILLVWQAIVRSSGREAARFGNIAHNLAAESSALEERLIIVNRELSLAREFLAAQTRELDSLGRSAGDRLSEHADRLVTLIRDNGEQVNAIGDVSDHAVKNMSKLRDDLPVIANSSRDVSNQIGNAGLTAKAQIEELIAGFDRLNQFAQASDRQVDGVSERVGGMLADFERQAEATDGLIRTRFETLSGQCDEFRADMDGREIDALAAMRARVDTMTGEIDAIRDRMAADERDAASQLSVRMAALRDDGAEIANGIREGEDMALTVWRKQIDAMQAHLRQAVEELQRIDDNALEASNHKLTALVDEANAVDAKLAERDTLFNRQIVRRRDELAKMADEGVASLDEQLASIDGAIARRREDQLALTAALAEQGAAVESSASALNDRFADLIEFGDRTTDNLTQNADRLTGILADGQLNVAETRSGLTAATEESVRLLELIQGALHHSRVDLTEAIGAASDDMTSLADRAKSVQAVVEEANDNGAKLSDHLAATRDLGNDTISLLGELEDRLRSAGGEHGASLDRLNAATEKLRGKISVLASDTERELLRAIDSVDGAGRAAAERIGAGATKNIDAIADDLGRKSAHAINNALTQSVHDGIAELEASAVRAAQGGQAATAELLDQLATVNELAENLERRIDDARERAQERTDNDFARRMALIVESLNSSAIDIAKGMSSDISDTAWTAYLRGDRGIFTRRAVQLIDSGTAREIADVYDTDEQFREHVTRYIHDFEAMLRSMLSTRDGNAIGITLLSSDMGKLYVALAQAIERLRN